MVWTSDLRQDLNLGKVGIRIGLLKNIEMSDISQVFEIDDIFT